MGARSVTMNYFRIDFPGKTCDPDAGDDIEFTAHLYRKDIFRRQSGEILKRRILSADEKIFPTAFLQSIDQKLNLTFPATNVRGTVNM